MSNKKECEQCGSEMKQVAKSKGTNKRKVTMNIRRFQCTNSTCKHIQTFFGDAEHDQEEGYYDQERFNQLPLSDHP